MKKIFTTAFLLLAALMLKAQTFNAGDWWFTVTDADTRQVELTLYPEAALPGDIMIPGTATHEGVEYTVTSLGYKALANFTNITGITIPESVTNIGADAFSGCTGLTKITIPAGVKTIGEYAFYNCISLAEITLSEGVETIGQYAFAY